MQVRMTHVGGPLDGTIEFNEEEKYPMGSIEYVLSRGTYEMTKGAIGKSAQCVSPAVIDKRQTGDLDDTKAAHATIHQYFIIDRNEENGVLHVTAEHRPIYRPMQRAGTE